MTPNAQRTSAFQQLVTGKVLKIWALILCIPSCRYKGSPIQWALTDQHAPIKYKQFKKEQKRRARLQGGPEREEKREQQMLRELPFQNIPEDKLTPQQKRARDIIASNFKRSQAMRKARQEEVDRYNEMKRIQIMEFQRKQALEMSKKRRKKMMKDLMVGRGQEIFPHWV
jgi:hypothetical protein